MPAQPATSRTVKPVNNPEAYAEKYTQDHAASPEDYLTAGAEPPHDSSLTEVAAEALRTGLYPTAAAEAVPGQDDILRVGDPDVDPLQNLYTGDELPGGSMPTPDQSGVEEISRAAGIEEADSGGLRAAEEIAERRDRRRWDQESLSPKT